MQYTLVRGVFGYFGITRWLKDAVSFDSGWYLKTLDWSNGGLRTEYIDPGTHLEISEW